MIKPAIVAVGYNRPNSMERLLKSIVNAVYTCDDVTLIISIDVSDKSEEIAKIAQGISWRHGNKIIRRFPIRQGLRSHILQCGDLVEKYDAVIILEDDLVVSPSFYQYALEAVNHYLNEPKLAGFALYSHHWNGYANLQFIPMHNQYDAYLGQFSITWGECWTKKQWENFRKWYDECKGELVQSEIPDSITHWGNQSWGKYFVTYIVKMDLYYLIPYVSMSTNFSDVGQHNKRIDSSHQVPLLEGVKDHFFFPPTVEAIKYDVFFERIFDGVVINNIEGNRICVNLNLTKKTNSGKEYIITTDQLSCTIVASYSMKMHPIDANVTHNISGKEIFLYYCGNIKVIFPNKRLFEKRLNFELYDYWWPYLFKESLYRFAQALKNKVIHCHKGIQNGKN